METNTALFNFCVRQGDSSLILGQRLSALCGHGPILEEDIALTNISLDLIGQASTLFTFAASIENKGRTEDELAYHRGEREFTNALLVEQPNGDFAMTIVRQFLFDSYQFYLFQSLEKSVNNSLAEFATKFLKEVQYHLRHSTQWLLRLGDGTEESHNRTQKALDYLWSYTGDLFAETDGDELLCKQGVIFEAATLHKLWTDHITASFAQATLNCPATTFMHKGSRLGQHTEHLGFVLAEMQYIPRTFPGATW